MNPRRRRTIASFFFLLFSTMKMKCKEKGKCFNPENYINSTLDSAVVKWMREKKEKSCPASTYKALNSLPKTASSSFNLLFFFSFSQNVTMKAFVRKIGSFTNTNKDKKFGDTCDG
jgi:hypothetical protein